MKIELIGCTSAGKSTLLNNMMASHRNGQPEIISGDDFVLRQMYLAWLPHRIFRVSAINIIGIFWCILNCRKQKRLLNFSYEYLRKLPSTITFRERLKIARILVRNIGIHEFIACQDTTNRIIIIDEGILHIAHYLFVHESIEPDLKQLQTFIELAPCEDVVVYLCALKKTLIERTRVRGHKRIPDGSLEAIESFINHAITTFNFLGGNPKINPKLLLVSPDKEVSMASGKNDSPMVEKAKHIILTGLEEASL
ncbi:hypothetical protein [Photobacterium sp.]|uniref:hypothetical protein n=1 Tax=Photobacterium sp. TaxID=660 RepID=UPI00299D6ACB|nr:hypothetical protein [Photobacterium sp.]MDX1301624.1 hypothetical protein [Photobacterium sp.]